MTLADHDTANAKLAENGDTKQNDSPRSSKLLRQMNGLTHRLDLSDLRSNVRTRIAQDQLKALPMSGLVTLGVALTIALLLFEFWAWNYYS